MSFYSYLEGYIEFEKKEDFDKMANAIIEGGWYNPKTNTMYYEGDCEADEDVEDFEGNIVEKLINPDKLAIGIPCANYRNLDRVFELDGVKFKGTVKGESTDGCDSAWLYKDGEYFDCDLEEYAKEAGMEWCEDNDSDNDGYWDCRNDVMERFYKEPIPKANSQKFIEEDNNG